MIAPGGADAVGVEKAVVFVGFVVVAATAAVGWYADWSDLSG